MSCSPAELISVSIEQSKFQFNQLYLQTVEKGNHLPDELGIYIRQRIGIPLGQKVLREDLIKYGRDTISISLIEEGVYFFDFSVK
jgi:hypothetical protein